jgi:tetratricopeptide (TPR) repeat protein
MSAQSEGEYAEALQNYYQAMRLEIDPYDRSYILYNIALIHTSNGEHAKALEYYYQAIDRNPALPQAFNNMAVICHYVRPFTFTYSTKIILLLVLIAVKILSHHLPIFY